MPRLESGRFRAEDHGRGQVVAVLSLPPDGMVRRVGSNLRVLLILRVSAVTLKRLTARVHVTARVKVGLAY